LVDIPSQSYGQGEALTALQQAAPLPSAEAAPSEAAPTGGGGGPPGPVFGESAFRPTERPGEAVTSGIPFGPGDSGQNQILPTDTVDAFLRALYASFPSDAILRLLKE
jgi:hypothetical protein